MTLNVKSKNNDLIDIIFVQIQTICENFLILKVCYQERGWDQLKYVLNKTYMVKKKWRSN